MGKGHQGTCIKNVWTKPKAVGLSVVGGGGWRGKVVAGKWRQLYMNNNLKNFKNKPKKKTFIGYNLII